MYIYMYVYIYTCTDAVLGTILFETCLILSVKALCIVGIISTDVVMSARVFNKLSRNNMLNSNPISITSLPKPVDSSHTGHVKHNRQIYIYIYVYIVLYSHINI
jgi:hypothetical protein